MMDSKLSSQREEEEKSKIMTNVLIDKIGQLQSKVRELEEEKKIFLAKIKEMPNLV